MDKQNNQQLPNWLSQNSQLLPQIYQSIWDYVKEDRSLISGVSEKYLVDTNKVFPLLLTSQLPTEILGFIWSLANKKYAGQLTQQELYIVLSLIAVAQTSYSFTSLDVLHMLPGPPIPSLNLSILYPLPKLNSSQIDSNHYENNEAKKYTTVDSLETEETIYKKTIQSMENKSTNQSQISTTIDLSDDFSEFQSATVIQPTIPIIDKKLGSAIGSRLANHNLSGPKKNQDKLKNSNNKNLTIIKSTVNNFTKDLTTLNKNLTDCERLGDLFPTCMIKNEAQTVILKDTVIRNDISIPIERNNDELKNELYKEKKNDMDLMNLQGIEDKYSALRILVDEPIEPLVVSDKSLKIDDKKLIDNNNDNIFIDTNDLTDDFGDFISAPSVDIPITIDNNQLDSSMDLFTDFENFLPSCGDHKSEISLVQETIEAFAQLEINSSPEKTLDYLEEKYEATIDPDKIIQRDGDTLSVNSINQGILTQSESIPNLDFESCFDSSVNDADKDIENMHQTIYWEWKQYMESCVLLLQLAANIFTNISSDTVLQEVIKSAQGYNFLCNLAEVAAVCRRVNYSHKEMEINIMGFDDLLMNIDKIWAQMEPFYTNIPIVTELPAWPSRQGKTPTCALCLTVITSDNIIFNDNNYHATCANLWLNCVNNNLPILRYPINNSNGILNN